MKKTIIYLSLLCVAVAVIGATTMISVKGPTKIENTQDQQEITVNNQPQEEVIDTRPGIEDIVSTPQSSQASSEDAIQKTYILPHSGTIIKTFSPDKLLYSITYDDYRIHTGIDIQGQKGDNVKAVADGKIKSVYTDPQKGIVIVLDTGEMEVLYANLSTDIMVEEGDEVKQGDIISGVGDSSAFEKGEQFHLHLEIIKDGININPLDILKN